MAREFDFGFERENGLNGGGNSRGESPYVQPSNSNSESPEAHISRQHQQSPPPSFNETQSTTYYSSYARQPMTPDSVYLNGGRHPYSNDFTRHYSGREKRSYGQESDFTHDGSSESDYNLYETMSNSELNPQIQPGIPLATQQPPPAWPRQTPLSRSRTYVPIPEMSQVYQADDFHQNIHPQQAPPQHNFNDPEDQFYYDHNKYNPTAGIKNRGQFPDARVSTSSIATGVIDFEDAHDGDPDHVAAVDDDFYGPTVNPLNQINSNNSSSRPGTRTANRADENLRRYRTSDRKYNEELQRRLGARHLQMIALGGTLGVGLFLASGKALSVAGPLGSLLGYTSMGIVVLCVMLSLGEMTALIPIAGGITAYAGRFVDDALGFAAGWMYWMSFALALPTEVTAASILIRYYRPLGDEKLLALWITIFLAMVIITNCFNVRVYGEMEYFFGLLKVVTILALIITMIIINAGGSPTGTHIGFANWNKPDGPFRQYLVPGTLNTYRTQFYEYPNITGGLAHFLAIWGSFTIAAFSFLGTEIVAVAAGEVANSRYSLPSAVRRLFWRIAIFYVLGIFVVGLNVKSTSSVLLQFHDSTSSQRSNGQALGAHSPWVIAITEAAIPILPGVVNGIFVFCAWSAGNSHLYASSRTLYGLSVEGKAPRIFRRCTASGVPIVAVGTSALVSLLAYIQCAGSTGQTVFDYLLRTTTVAGLIVWATFCIAYIRFYAGLKQVRHIDRNSENYPYKGPFQPVLAYIGLIFTILTVLFNGFDYFLDGRQDPNTGEPISRAKDFASDFLTAYLSLFIFLALFLFWKFYKKTTFQPLNRLNLDTGMAYGMDERRRHNVPMTRKFLNLAAKAVG